MFKLIKNALRFRSLQINLKATSPAELRLFFDLHDPEDQSCVIVDDKTWVDLDMDEVFLRIDRTVTPVGQQYLYSLLREMLKNKAQLEDRYSRILDILANKAATDRPESLLRRLELHSANNITKLLYSKLDLEPLSRAFTLSWSLLSLTLICVLPIIDISYFGIVILLVACNFLIAIRFEKTVSKNFAGIFYTQELVSTDLLNPES
ncbi:MAG: hypothetical protein U5O39_10645 [Gammaproteobacteria bacterium]|nr:hypothetical protein [Gammaproteobacteria bacterium]